MFSSDQKALPILSSLRRNFKLVGVVGSIENKTDVPLLRPEKLDKQAIDWILEKKADVMVCAYFGQFIPKELVEHNEFGIVNIHPSLLPKWRGPSPAQAAIAAGDKITGVTFIKMDNEFDHGPILAQIEEEIRGDDTAESLYKRLYNLAAENLGFVIGNYIRGKIAPREQDHNKATYCKMIKKEDGFVEARKLRDRKEAVRMERLIRAYYPWPTVWTKVSEKRLKILKAHLDGGELVLDEVQLEGKKPVSWRQFVDGHPTLAF